LYDALSVGQMLVMSMVKVPPTSTLSATSAVPDASFTVPLWPYRR
jgi:hypothetical protein